MAQPPLIVFKDEVRSLFDDRRRACGKCGKAHEAFPSSCGNPHQEEAAEGHRLFLRISIAAAFSTGRFLFLFWFFFLCLMSSPCGKPAASRYESATLLGQRFQETFERDELGKLDVCSDDVLRGLDYKDYGHFLPVWF
jgi:hypothetical protein